MKVIKSILLLGALSFASDFRYCETKLNQVDEISINVELQKFYNISSKLDSSKLKLQQISESMCKGLNKTFDTLVLFDDHLYKEIITKITTDLNNLNKTIEGL